MCCYLVLSDITMNFLFKKKTPITFCKNITVFCTAVSKAPGNCIVNFWNSDITHKFLCRVMATHSSTIAWKIPWTEEPGGLQSMGSPTTERLHFHFSLTCIREGNGNPLQFSCLENPRDGGAWWAAVCGVAQSRT